MGVHCSLSQFPQVSVSSFAADMQALLDEADTMDSIHDVEVKVEISCLAVSGH